MVVTSRWDKLKGAGVVPPPGVTVVMQKCPPASGENYDKLRHLSALCLWIHRDHALITQP